MLEDVRNALKRVARQRVALFVLDFLFVYCHLFECNHQWDKILFSNVYLYINKGRHVSCSRCYLEAGVKMGVGCS